MSEDNVINVYKYIISDVGILLKTQGYRRTGSTFFATKAHVHTVINFQKSLDSNRYSIKFTVNLGSVIYSILEEWRRMKNTPAISDAQINTRLGMLMPERADKWWIIDKYTKQEYLSQEIFHCLN